MRPLLLTALLVVGCHGDVRNPSSAEKMNAEVMRELRLKMLTASAELGLKPTQEYPLVCGVLMDWPIDAGTVTIVSLSTGDASIYSTGTFGVFGGIGHETVRSAAKDLVRVGEQHYDEATPTEDYPYPKPEHVRFYLVCYDGVRTIDADLKSVATGNHKCSDLYEHAQRVISELRLITENQNGEKP